MELVNNNNNNNDMKLLHLNENVLKQSTRKYVNTRKTGGNNKTAYKEETSETVTSRN